MRQACELGLNQKSSTPSVAMPKIFPKLEQFQIGTLCPSAQDVVMSVPYRAKSAYRAWIRSRPKSPRNVELEQVFSRLL